MTKYIHDPAPSGRAKVYIKACAKNITAWPEGAVSVASFMMKNRPWTKRADPRAHHNGLSRAWAVCTKRQWLEARGES